MTQYNKDYYNSSYANANSWLLANDPSPSGYRVPTLAEVKSLLNTTYVTSVWATRNGKSGQVFTDKASGASIFWPAGNRFI